MIHSTGLQNYTNFTQRYAKTIESHPVRLYYERPVMLRLLEDVAGKQVLDAGCGHGEYSEWLVQEGAQVTAFDLMPDFVAMTQARTQGRAHVLQADLAQPLHFAEDRAFDLILSALTLHYLSDWTGVLGEFWRVLRPGGKLVFSVMHPMTDTEAVSYFETGLYETIWTNFGEPYPVLRLYHRPLSAMINPLVAVGFSLADLHEPQPLPALHALEPATYATLIQKPIFLVLRAIKQQGVSGGT